MKKDLISKILWICPSRCRPDRLERLILSWKNTTEGYSDLLVAIDTDDRSYDSLIIKYPEVLWEINDPIFGSFLKLLNDVALKYSQRYKYLGFMEDDIVFETPNYEKKFIKKLEELGDTGIVHAMDGVDKKKFISIPVINSHIVRKLGWFSPPCLKSLWADNFWRAMAEHLKTYYKFHDVMIRHYHYSKDTNTQKDKISEIVDANYGIDQQNFYHYMDNDFLNDMEKLNG